MVKFVQNKKLLNLKRCRAIVAFTSLFLFVFFSSFLCLASLSFNNLEKSFVLKDTPHAKVGLQSSHKKIGWGEKFYLAWLFKLEPGWHIYWKNPGDSGLAPKLNESTSQTKSLFSLKEFIWPLPKKIRLGPLVNYGYEEQVLLPLPASLSKKAFTDSKETGKEKRASFSFLGEWLICKENCLPVERTFHLNLVFSPTSEIREDIWAEIQKIQTQAKPPSLSLKASFVTTEEGYLIKLKDPKSWTLEYENIDFFASQGLRIKHSAPLKEKKKTKKGWQFFVEKDPNAPSNLASLTGLYVFSTEGFPDVGMELTALTHKQRGNFVQMMGILFFAFLGGLILNLMPCVFPVLSLKTLSFVEKVKEDKKILRKEGWAFASGIWLSFLLLACLLILLKTLGEQIGWGFQLQYPPFVMSMCLVFFLMALSLMGFFEIGGSWMRVGEGLTQKKGVLSRSFFTGFLAVLVATPCTAPFMGTAIGFALTQSFWVILIVFFFLAAGMNFPYLILSYFPFWLKFLPRPGAWMESFRQFLAFPLFLTSLWLLWILKAQGGGKEGRDLILETLLLSLMLVFALWLHKRFLSKMGQWAFVLSLVLTLTPFAWPWLSATQSPLKTKRQEERKPEKIVSLWYPFDPKLRDQWLLEGKSVFIDFTALWCLTCQVNKRLVLNRASVLAMFQKAGVQLMRADWTNKDPQNHKGSDGTQKRKCSHLCSL